MPEFDHLHCWRTRLVGDCGALAVCKHGGVDVYTEWLQHRSPVHEVTPEREAELRARVGSCV